MSERRTQSYTVVSESNYPSEKIALVYYTIPFSFHKRGGVQKPLSGLCIKSFGGRKLGLETISRPVDRTGLVKI